MRHFGSRDAKRPLLAGATRGRKRKCYEHDVSSRCSGVLQAGGSYWQRGAASRWLQGPATVGSGITLAAWASRSARKLQPKPLHTQAGSSRCRQAKYLLQRQRVYLQYDVRLPQTAPQPSHGITLQYRMREVIHGLSCLTHLWQFPLPPIHQDDQQ